MRHALVRLTGLLIVLMLVLTGCNLIGVDPIMKLDEDFAKLAKRYSGVVASYDGGEVTQADVMANLSTMYNNYSQMYSMFGYSVPADVITTVENSVAEQAVQNVAIAKQMEARGLKLEDDKLAELQAEADEHYTTYYDSFYANVTEKKEDVHAKQTEYNMAVNGFTKEALYAIEVAEANRALVEQNVRDEIAELTDEELQTAYEAKLKEDEDKYSASAGSFESDMSSEDEVVTWIPEGYRTVKHILVVPEDDVLNAYTDARKAYEDAQSDLDDLNDELEELSHDHGDEADEEADEEAEPQRTAEEIQADIDAAKAKLETLKADMDKAAEDCLANVKSKTDEIYAKLESGEDFAKLIEDYGEDPGMQNEPTKTTGYYVSADSTNWDKNFTEGAMALEKVGDVTQTPVVGSSGVHIIRYETDVKSGPVALEEIRDALYEKTLETAKDEHFTSELNSWVEALNPQYHIEAFNLTGEDQ